MFCTHVHVPELERSAGHFRGAGPPAAAWGGNEKVAILMAAWQSITPAISVQIFTLLKSASKEGPFKAMYVVWQN